MAAQGRHRPSGPHQAHPRADLQPRPRRAPGRAHRGAPVHGGAADRGRRRRRALGGRSDRAARPGVSKRRGADGPDGLAVVDKDAGWTSHDVVAKSRGLLGTRKVGHSGTLDPDATGVLLLGVGRVTRLLRYLTALGKTYTCEIVLGAETTTLDDSGEVTATHDMSAVTPDAGRGRRRDADRADPADPADGVGGEGRRAAPARAGPRGHRGRTPAPTGHRPPLRRHPGAGRAAALPGRGRVLVGHLRAHPGRRPRHRPRGRRPPARPAPHRHRLVLARRRRAPRATRPRRGSSPRPRRCATTRR